MTFSQAEFDVRCEWSEQGIDQVVPISDVVIIVDVLSFSTSVDITTNRNAMIFPYRWKDTSAAVFAASVGAIVADASRKNPGYPLSPQLLLHLPFGTRLVLPSPKGATLSLGTGRVPTLTWCLRNAQASEVLRIIRLAFEEYRSRLVPPSGALTEMIDDIHTAICPSRRPSAAERRTSEPGRPARYWGFRVPLMTGLSNAERGPRNPQHTGDHPWH